MHRRWSDGVVVRESQSWKRWEKAMVAQHGAPARSSSVKSPQQSWPNGKQGDVAWMPLNPDWGTWLQGLYMAVQNANNCYTELEELRSAGASPAQRAVTDELVMQSYQLWQSLERFVGPQIEIWERAIGT